MSQFVVSFFKNHPVIASALSLLLAISFLSLLNRIGVFQPVVRFILSSLGSLGRALSAAASATWQCLLISWVFLVENVFSPFVVFFLRPLANGAVAAGRLVASGAVKAWTFCVDYIFIPLARAVVFLYRRVVLPVFRALRKIIWKIVDGGLFLWDNGAVPVGKFMKNWIFDPGSKGIFFVHQKIVASARWLYHATVTPVIKFSRWVWNKVVLLGKWVWNKVVLFGKLVWKILVMIWRNLVAVSKFVWRYFVMLCKLVWRVLKRIWQKLIVVGRDVLALLRKFNERVISPLVYLLEWTVWNPLKRLLSPVFRFVYFRILVPLLVPVFDFIPRVPFLLVRLAGLSIVFWSGCDVEWGFWHVTKRVLAAGVGFWLAGAQFRTGVMLRCYCYVLVQSLLARSPFVSAAYMFALAQGFVAMSRSRSVAAPRVALSWLLFLHGCLFVWHATGVASVLAAYACMVVAASALTFPPFPLARKLFFLLDFGVISFILDRSSGTLSRFILQHLLRMRLWMFHVGELARALFRPFYLAARRVVLFVWRNPIVGALLVVAVAAGVVFLDAHNVQIVPSFVTFANFWSLLRSLQVGSGFVAYLKGSPDAFQRSGVQLMTYCTLLAFSVAARHKFMAKVYQDKIDVSARDAALTLMCIHRFRRREMGQLGWLHHDTIREIAKYVYGSRIEDNRVWVRTIV